MDTYTEDQVRAMTRAERRRLRARGIEIPKLGPGPNKGYKQSPEHVAKRVRSGPDHHAWKGDEATQKAGRSRALRMYKEVGPCVLCGAEKTERHHMDGNTLNNEPGNILAVCRSCHMKEDGRLENFIRVARENQPKAVAARRS